MSAFVKTDQPVHFVAVHFTVGHLHFHYKKSYPTSHTGGQEKGNSETPHLQSTFLVPSEKGQPGSSIPGCVCSG